jgi:hypothetical protein
MRNKCIILSGKERKENPFRKPRPKLYQKEMLKSVLI